MKKIFLVMFLFIISITSNAEAASKISNSADAFMSLPFGHSYARTQKRMERSGAKVLTPRKESLTMEGFFEGYPAVFIFGFYKNKLLNSKSVYLQSMGKAEQDKNFYEAMQKGYNAAFNSSKANPVTNTRNAKKINLQNVWTPDRYTTITLTYNPDASKRLPGESLSEKFLQLIYKYDKWE